MKRILIAGMLALGIHGFLLGPNWKLSGRTFFKRPKIRVMNITFALQHPEKITSRPAFKKPKPVLNKPAVIKKVIQKPINKHVIKTPLQKIIKVPVPTKKKDLSKKVTEKTIEITKPRFEPEPNALKAVSKETDQNTVTQSVLKVVHEARPIYQSNPPPKYPVIARIRGYQGNVMLDVLVDRDGKVADLKMYKSSGYPPLDRAAKSAVKKWLFEPGMIGKNKVDMWVRVPIRFELKE